MMSSQYFYFVVNSLSQEITSCIITGEGTDRKGVSITFKPGRNGPFDTRVSYPTPEMLQLGVKKLLHFIGTDNKKFNFTGGS